MSLFRPDSQLAPPVFIPHGLGGLVQSIVSKVVAEPIRDFTPVHPSGKAKAGRSAETHAAPSPQEISALEQAAFDRGVETARVESTRLESVCLALEAAARRLEAAAKTSVGANRDLVLLLAAEIAQRWVGAELTTDAAKFGVVLDRAIAACDASTGIRLELHAEDMARLEASDPDRIARWSESETIEIVSAVDLEPGAFRVEAGSETIDGRPEAIVAGLRDALVEAFDADWPEGVK